MGKLLARLSEKGILGIYKNLELADSSCNVRKFDGVEHKVNILNALRSFNLKQTQFTIRIWTIIKTA